MTQDIHHYLQAAGYLDTPAQRLLWRWFSPGLRGQVHTLIQASLVAALPSAALIAALSFLRGGDRAIIFLCYLVALTLAMMLIDLAMALLVHLRLLGKLWQKKATHLVVPLIAGCLYLFFMTQFLNDPIRRHATSSQWLIWPALFLCAQLVAIVARVRLVSRLYWHGVRPPKLRAQGWMAATVLLIVGALLSTLKPHRLDSGTSILAAKNPVLLLAFDLPEGESPTAQFLPRWTSQKLGTASGDITHFWAGVGTGTDRAHHQASLYRFKTPLFKHRMDGNDVTQKPILWLLRQFGAADPLADGGRYRKYAWEILDQHGLPTQTFAFWHTYPAQSQNGGVMSERWRPEVHGFPYASGLQPLPTKDTLNLDVPRPLKGVLQRETQTWAQLLQGPDTALRVAYFPLADLLESLPPAEAKAAQTLLMNFRSAQLQNLLATLDPHTPVGLIIASGKAAAQADRLKAQLLANDAWMRAMGPKVGDSRRLAAMLLNYFGLPSDRYMYPALTSPDHLAKADYGEIRRTPTANESVDSSYYRQLKALGYIQ